MIHRGICFFFCIFTFFSRPTTPPRRRLLFSAFFSKTAPIVPALGSPTPRHAADCRICQICYSFGMFRQIYYKQIYKHLPIVDKFWRARSRLDRSRFLQLKFKKLLYSIFKIYKICTFLHRYVLKTYKERSNTMSNVGGISGLESKTDLS